MYNVAMPRPFNMRAARKAKRLKNKGYSYRQIAAIMSEQQGREIQHNQVIRWVRVVENQVQT